MCLSELPTETLNAMSDSSADFLDALHTLVCIIWVKSNWIKTHYVSNIAIFDPSFKLVDKAIKICKKWFHGSTFKEMPAG